jgi:serine protease Do
MPFVSQCLVLAAAAALPVLAGAKPTTSGEEDRRVELVARIERSAVLVLAAGGQAAGEGGSGPEDPRGGVGLGAGVIVRRDGLIVTAAHVVADAAHVAVKLERGDPVEAMVVLIDSASDLALLRLVDPLGDLVPAVLGDSDRVRKGETVYVFGNPRGLERSLSVGVVSARHPLRRVIGGSVEVEAIQTDAAVNPGNSGGPMFNSRGELIAISQRILSRSGGSEGLGFGLAVNAVKKILGLDPCVWLGFSGVVLTDDFAAALNVPRNGGLLVQRVTPRSPAADAGMQEGTLAVRVGEEIVLLGGDVVLEANGAPFMEWVRTPPTGGTPGERHEYRLLVLRSGRMVEVPIVAVHRSAW